MKKRPSLFTLCCSVFLFVFVFFMIWYIPASSSLRSSVAEVRQSLETSRGRENKQRNEYETAVAELPEVQARLIELKPLVEQAEETVNTLKARRKDLRAEKKELEKEISGTEPVQEEKTDE